MTSILYVVFFKQQIVQLICAIACRHHWWCINLMMTRADMEVYNTQISRCPRYSDRVQTESDAYELTMQVAQTG